MSDFHSRITPIVSLIQGPPAVRNLSLAAKECTQLRKDFPDVIASYDVSAFCSTQIGNFDAAQYFLSEVARRSADPAQPIANLDAVLRQGRSQYSANDYMERTKQGLDPFIHTLLSESKALIDQGDLKGADVLIQQAVALKNPETTPLPSLGACIAQTRQLDADNKLQAQLAQLEKNFADLWLDPTSTNVAGVHELLSTLPDRNWTAEKIVTLLKKSSAHTILELGCFSGFNLGHIEEIAKQDGLSPNIYGVEPNAHVVEFATSKYPNISFHTGTFQNWIDGSLDIPASFDILVLNRFLQIFAPENVSQILAHAATCCRYIFIADDVMNWDGEQVLFRNNLNILYPFKQTLAQHGFEITDVFFAKDPDRAFTGCIIAKNQSSL